MPVPTSVMSVVATGAGVTAGNGDLNAGDTVTLTVNMSAAVTVASGVPTLSLNDLGIATYDAAHSTSTALAFNYTVAAGQNTADLAVTAVHLNGATIKDGASNNADLTAAVTNPAGTLQIDTIGPQIQSFAASDPLQTNAADVHYTLTFSESVTGVNAGAFSLVTTGVTGASIASVTPVSGAHGAQYNITVDTGTGNGTIALDLSGAAIQDLAGNPLLGGTFQPQASYAVGFDPFSVTIGDLNGDGRPDLVTANFGSIPPTVSVLLGNGDGTFQPQTTFATGRNPSSVQIGDLNGDGRADLVVADDDAPGAVSVLLGNGDGTFQPQATYATGPGPISVAIADLNGDGRPDLAAATPSFNSNSVSVLIGNGDGTFQPQTAYGAGVEPFSLAIGDLNGDGKLDLVTANFGADTGPTTVSVLLGKGDGTFLPQTTYATTGTPLSVAIGDLNGDGKPDLVTASDNTNTLSVFLGNGDGTFHPETTYVASTGPSAVAISDFNGDGKPDLVTANFGSNTAHGSVSLLLGNGDGTFQPQTTYPTETGADFIAVADLNGDGRPDVATATAGVSTVSVLLNGPSTIVGPIVGPTYTINKTGPTPHWIASIDVGPHPAGWLPTAIGDFNGDGTSDIAWFNATTGDVDIWKIANGQWAGSVDVGPHPAGWELSATGDFNHDGTSDILWYNHATNSVDIWLMSNGHWAASSSIDPHPAGWVPAGAGDFNNDGTSDVLWYNSTTGDAEVWKISNGRYAGTVDIGTHPAGYQPSVIGDFNGDGTSDIAWYNPTTGDVDIWKIANGQWAGSVDVGPHPAGWQPLGTGDFNKDGTSDIVWYNPATNDIDIWLISNGHWAASVDLGSHPAGSVAVGVGDFDHNGVPDIMWRDTSTGHIENWMLAYS